MRRCAFALLLALLGVFLFASGQPEEAQDTPSAAPTGEAAFPDEWLDPPTASEAGITSFQQAPMLDALVQSGELPPVEDRLPDDPLVRYPVERIGEYGGEAIAAATSPNGWADVSHSRIPYLFNHDMGVTTVIPNIAKGFEFSDDATELIIYLRPGMRWSDGEPFTTDDVMFWYEDLVMYEGAPVWNPWRVAGVQVEFQRIDDYSFRMIFPKPFRPAMGMLNFFMSRQQTMFQPKHYLSQFHIKYNADANELARSEGYETWVQLFQAHQEIGPGQTDPNMPVLGAWMLESRSQTEKVFVRNPYYWAVDPDGNQLPYLDYWKADIISDQEVAILQAMQGSLDFAAMILRTSDFELYKDNESRGDYRVLQYQAGNTSQVAYVFNLTHPDEEYREIFQDDRFRQAMSVAINRDEINAYTFLGLGIPGQATVDSNVSYYNPEWGDAYAQYDLDLANQLLDDMGMARGSDGFRRRPDGSEFVLVMDGTGEFGSGEVNELVAQYWEAAGINVNLRTISRDLYLQRVRAGEHMVGIWRINRMEELRSYVPGFIEFEPGGKSLNWGLDWWTWYQHDRWEKAGRQGTEPPTSTLGDPPVWVQDYFDLRDRWHTAADEEDYQRYAREYWDFFAERTLVIGTVGKPVVPAIVTNELRNVLSTSTFGDGTSSWYVTQPDQWFRND